jgi:hypothetical protein
LLAPVPISPAEERPTGTTTVLLPAPDVGHDEQLLSSGKTQRKLASITATTTQEPVRPNLDAGLLAEVERLRWSEPRFLRIEVVVRDGRIFLDGEVAHGADGMDFARRVARITGVVDVILRTHERPLLPGRTP